MRSNKRPNRFSPLAIRLFTRYLLSLAVLFAAVVGGYFFAAFVCYRFTWSENDPLYYLLKVVEQLSPVLIVLLLLAGFVWFTVRALRQPLGYLDDVIAAAKSLSDPPHRPLSCRKSFRTWKTSSILRGHARRKISGRGAKPSSEKTISSCILRTISKRRSRP